MIRTKCNERLGVFTKEKSYKGGGSDMFIECVFVRRHVYKNPDSNLELMRI